MKNRRSIDALTLSHFWAMTKKHRREFWISWLLPVPAIGLSIVIPFIIGKLFSTLATNPKADITPLFIWLAVVSIVTVVVNRIAFTAHLALQPKVAAELQTEAFDHLLKRSAGFHANRISGKLVSDALDYPNAYAALAGTFFIDALPFAITIVIGLTTIAVGSPILALVLFGMTALAIITGTTFRARMTVHRKRRQAAGKLMAGHIGDTLVNNQTVKAFGNEDVELLRHKELNTTFTSLKLHDWHAVAVDGGYRIAGLLLFELLFVIVVIHQVRSNPALLATGIFAFTYTITLTNRLFQIGTMMRQVDESLLQAMPMTEALQEDIEIQDIPNAKSLVVDKAEVTFTNVQFSYPEAANKAVFANLTLAIKPGEKVGLVGPSGGGKSTLTRLLLRFEDVQAGTISIDGQNIANITQTSLRKAIAYVPQEPLLFHRSVHENIAYAKPDATLDEVVKAAKLAYAHEFIQDLSDSYDTVVGERGVKLSGGQRQRIAIARAILKDAPILLLDEATSALDSESEQYIQKALQKLMKGRTTIVIAHRLSTIQSMDRIVVLDKGHIAESGTHSELLHGNGLYAKLWAHQSGGFLES